MSIFRRKACNKDETILLIFAVHFLLIQITAYMKKLMVLCCLIALLFAFRLSYSQVKIDSAEITASVPELNDFHEVIYPIWHTAYPAKDVAALKGFVPQIKASMEAINKAALPGILKDKEADWNKQLHELNLAAEKYCSAAEGNEDEALLVAAEKLHYNFEMMIRVIRPAIQELYAYHQLLYIIFHKLYPEKKYDEIAMLMDRLIEKADAIVKYPQDKLKRRLGDDLARFDSAAKELYKATISLKEALNGDDAKKNDEAVGYVHKMYQDLESVFQ
jgi:hypothetical protein